MVINKTDLVFIIELLIILREPILCWYLFQQMKSTRIMLMKGLVSSR